MPEKPQTGARPTEIRTSRVLVAGSAAGELLVLDEPLSLWGGLDADTGRIIDPRHPQLGESVTGRVLALVRGSGSSSASAILLEAVRQETAPAAILLRETDGILALGATVAREMYGRYPAVLVLAPDDFDRLETGWSVEMDEEGGVRLQQ